LTPQLFNISLDASAYSAIQLDSRFWSTNWLHTNFYIVDMVRLYYINWLGDAKFY